MPSKPLSALELSQALSDLEDWSHEGDKLTKIFRFKDFREAMGFMVRAAFDAEELDHHPEWLNVYNRVEIALTTHDAGNKVTAKDVELAKRLEAIAA